MDERKSTLRRLEAEPEDDVLRRTKEWLSRDDTQLIPAQDAHLTAYEAAHLWSVRLQISSAKGKPLFGAELLLSQLERLTPQKQLEQQVFTSPDLAGSLFFEKGNGRFVGAVISESVEPSTLRAS